ncbi:hypothetical protein AVEN_254031-1 [Araneus ventricosus]|uniref:Uncharacterized protein n=1 Tax=Araneus ventricosus TaxID=182803 RepID=A0A4Y2E5W9_ARAVE|nr:hypothetical protein AVEN_254031-1 [Araneus ventricosus]
MFQIPQPQSTSTNLRADSGFPPHAVRQGFRVFVQDSTTVQNSTNHSPIRTSGDLGVCQPHAMNKVQMVFVRWLTVQIPPTTVHKVEPRATRGLPSHTPWEQGFRSICTS